ncbi:hypothetical protein LshimejAT787_0201560 [Lyophyllum shimeji]|uniref:Uncharacterized protein n=1 Tax=Lyophyllum shimeji TaxID=47721 RepID=A0A9P3PFM8_LYOSH|nr:hypothetical protein LshimejAT787_0201560 [Lyophyllum shimeji]
MRFNALFTVLALAVALVAALPAPVKPGAAAPAPRAGHPPPTAKSGATTASKRTRPPKPKDSGPSHCNKRAGTCKNLFIVYYKPISAGLLRHWALFLTDAASADSPAASGTIYQVLADSQHPSGLAPYKLENKKVVEAGSFGGAALLGHIEASKVEAYYNSYKDFLLDDIGDHNTQRKNALDQSNCQHWTTDLVALMAEDEVLPTTAKTTMAGIPKK